VSLDLTVVAKVLSSTKSNQNLHGSFHENFVSAHTWCL